MYISARQAPIKPKIPPDAPTETMFGRKMALKMVPPIPGTTNRSRLEKKPWHCSTALPTNHKASMFNTKWMRPACNTMAEMILQTSPFCTINRDSFAPMVTRVSALGPNIGFTEKGSRTHPFAAIDISKNALQTIRDEIVK